jgi:2-(1,2-epoxy-1,2-dihydrophenyl)acetyl-CoA isomerase
MTEATSERQVLDYAVTAGVAWLRMNRPEARNAIDGALRTALAEAVRRAERDPEVRAVVVTGAPGAFCAGADLREFQRREGRVEEIRGQYERLLNGLRTMPKPTIAALNGVAAGIGASIAYCCDLRYAAPEASFVEAFVKIGLSVDGGVSWLLPRQIGRGKALEMCYTGAPLSASAAERLGLVNRVIELAELEPTVRRLAEELAAGPSHALGAIKRSFNHATTCGFEEALDFEFMLQDAMMEHPEFARRVAAFFERRRDGRA